jgi:hypothetical protein
MSSGEAKACVWPGQMVRARQGDAHWMLDGGYRHTCESTILPSHYSDAHACGVLKSRGVVNCAAP